MLIFLMNLGKLGENNWSEIQAKKLVEKQLAEITVPENSTLKISRISQRKLNHNQHSTIIFTKIIFLEG